MNKSAQSLNEQVRQYWEAEPCGTKPYMVGAVEPLSREWFEAVENYRYSVEPFIHSVAQFTRHHGKRVLEVGVGAGTDHLQWARAGTDLYGVDLTDAAIETTQKRLETYGLHSNLRRVDAECLPFENGFFDVVYSWGVIHHSEDPAQIIGEIKRVLRPGGVFIGMLYRRRSLLVIKVWIKQALLKGKPWRTFRDVLFNNVESRGTKAYSVSELRALFSAFENVSVTPVICVDSILIKGPKWVRALLDEYFSWFLVVKANR